MDEAPEFQRQVIDALRQPLESRTITINRSQGNYMYPANFICILAEILVPVVIIMTHIGNAYVLKRWLKTISNGCQDLLWTA